MRAPFVSTQAIILGPIRRRNGLDQSSAGMLFEQLRVITDSFGQSETGYTTRGNVVRDNVFENVRSHVSHPNQGAFGNMNVNAL